MTIPIEIKNWKSILYGHEYWYKNNCFHREDGPAIIHKDGSKFWYLNHNRFHSEEEWWFNLSDEDKIKSLFK